MGASAINSGASKAAGWSGQHDCFATACGSTCRAVFAYEPHGDHLHKLSISMRAQPTGLCKTQQ